MYLEKALILNSGALSDLELNASFNSDKSPKPIVLVGQNGSGKTGLLSIIADALIEIAAQTLEGVTPASGAQREYFRVLGGRSTRLGGAFELAVAKFVHQEDDFFFRSKSGQIQSNELSGRLLGFDPVANWPGQDAKFVTGPTQKVEAIYNSGAYIFFPVTRFEAPHWANLKMLERDPNARFDPIFSKRLNKEIVVQSTFDDLKPWILGLLADANLNAGEALNLQTLDEIRSYAMQKVTAAAPALSGLGDILTAIL